MSNRKEESQKWIKAINTTATRLTAVAALLAAVVSFTDVFSGEIKPKSLPTSESNKVTEPIDSGAAVSQNIVNNNNNVNNNNINAHGGNSTSNAQGGNSTSNAQGGNAKSNAEANVNVYPSDGCVNENHGDKVVQMCDSKNNQVEVTNN